MPCTEWARRADRVHGQRERYHHLRPFLAQTSHSNKPRTNYTMGFGPHVTLLASSSIVPASPTTVGRMFLPSADAFWQDIHYNRILIFYASAPNDAVKTLKTGLSLALVHYYPCAGRLALGEDKRLVIDCNDAGVEFVEATIDCALRDHAKTGYQMMGFYEQLCREVDHKGESLYTSPLVYVQVTRFLDGGLAVAVAQSHVVADGVAGWNFMVSWGECARGVPLTVVPIHDRERLALPNPSAEKALKMDMTRGGAEEEEEEEEEVGKPREVDIAKHTDGLDEQEIKTDVDDQQPLVQCVFVMPGAAIQKLKALTGGAHSSYVATCTHFWKHVTAARKPTGGGTTSFAGMGNLRSRCEPPLPPAYFGNVVLLGRVDARTTSIVEEAFHVTAGRVQRAVAKALDWEAFLGFMHWLELHDCKLLSNMDPSPFPGIHVVSSPRFPMYDVDYGWGRPAAVRSVKVQGNGEMVLAPGRPGSPPGDMEICMALPAPVLRTLLKDPDFLAHVPVSPFAEDDVSLPVASVNHNKTHQGESHSNSP